ncbi:unnamed protein product, partial [Ectocarpus sp. 13 AM-2016]
QVQRKTDLEAKEKRIRRALIEKEVLVACAHPFVCSLYTAFQDSRHLYLLMDYCAGGDLKTLVRFVAVRWFVSWDGLGAGRWFALGDLKPENVLIHASGHIRLGDFGTAERGRFKCQDVPGEKLCPEEVEKALGETGMSHAATAGGGGSASGGHTFSEEEEGDLDESNNVHHGGGADNSNGPPHEAARANSSSIIVQIDPFLTEASASSVAPAADRAEEAAEVEGEEEAASAGVAPAAAADRVDRPVCADDGDDSAWSGGGSGPPVGCGCGRRRGRGKSARGPASLSAGPGEPFAQGRGSVKLNVLLDSQTFIGTGTY